MSKIKTTFVLALLLTTILTAFPSFISVKASTGGIEIIDPVPPEVEAGANVTLDFSGVTWSGGQFYLVWSKDGFSQISSGDFKFTPTFKVIDLMGSPKAVGNYTIGDNKIEGPIPKEIAGGEYYIKAFDGTATSVAVTTAPLTVLPSFEVVPSWGPGGRAIQLKGYAFTANNYVNLSYYDEEWKTIKNLYPTDSIGRFVYSMAAPDLKLVLEAGEWPVDFVTIDFRAIDNKTESEKFDSYDEFYRGLIQVDGIKPPSGPGYLFGNATYFNVDYDLGVKVFEKLVIAGDFFYPGNVTFWFDGSKYLGSITANSTGFFNATVIIPEAKVGEHYILIKDAVIRFVFYFDIIPTLVLEPDTGPVGTVVTAKAYGFPEKILVRIWWYEKSYGEDEWYNLVNGTTGPDGKFNVTVKFTVPHAYGGDHDVEAWDIEDTFIAAATFTITARLSVVPSTFANDGSIVKVIGNGLEIWKDEYRAVYAIAVDNQFMGASGSRPEAFGGVAANATGDLVFEMVAAGFTPGLHVVSLYSTPRYWVIHGDAAGYSLDVYALFTVTGVSPDTQTILNNLATLSNSVDSLKTTLTQGVQNIRNDISGVKGDLATLSDSMSKGFSSVNSAVGTLTTSISNLGNSLSGQITSLGNTLSKSISDNANSLSGQITSLGNTLSKSISDNANSIQTSIKNAQDTVSSQVKSSVGDISTFLIIIGILAAITLVVEVAILLRRLS